MVHTRSPLREINGDKRFFLPDGRIIQSLEGLRDSLETMAPEAFSAQVNADHDNFRNWIHEVVKDEELARKLEGVHDRDKYHSIIKDRITEIHHRVDAEKLAKMAPSAPKQPDQQELGEPPPIGFADSEDESLVEDVVSDQSSARELLNEIKTEKGHNLPGKAPFECPKEVMVKCKVREFIYGLVTGLVIGFLLFRVL